MAESSSRSVAESQQKMSRISDNCSTWRQPGSSTWCWITTPACELRNTRRQLLAIRRDLHGGNGCVVARALCCMCWLSTTCGKRALLADGTHIAPPDGVFAWRNNRADRVWFRPVGIRVRGTSQKQVCSAGTHRGRRFDGERGPRRPLPVELRTTGPAYIRKWMEAGGSR